MEECFEQFLEKGWDIQDIKSLSVVLDSRYNEKQKQEILKLFLKTDNLGPNIGLYYILEGFQAPEIEKKLIAPTKEQISQIQSKIKIYVQEKQIIQQLVSQQKWSQNEQEKILKLFFTADAEIQKSIASQLQKSQIEYQMVYDKLVNSTLENNSSNLFSQISLISGGQGLSQFPSRTGVSKSQSPALEQDRDRQQGNDNIFVSRPNFNFLDESFTQVVVKTLETQRWNTIQIKQFLDKIQQKRMINEQKIEEIVDLIAENFLRYQDVDDYLEKFEELSPDHFKSHVQQINQQKSNFVRLSSLKHNLVVPQIYKGDNTLSDLIQNLRSNQVTPNYTQDILNFFAQQNFPVALVQNILLVIESYMAHLPLDIIKTVCQKPSENVPQELRRVANKQIAQQFKQVQSESTIQELKEEFKQLNSNQEYIFQFSDSVKLIQQAQAEALAIAPEKARSWATDQLKKVRNPNYTLKALDIGMLIAGFKAVRNLEPRITQLISVFMLFNQSKQGRLAQVHTGEGKTSIVAMLAILVRLFKAKSIDIITSSEVLAKRDAEELRPLYQFFGVTVSNNIDAEHFDQKKLCYSQSVVYGDAHHFMADILHQEYSKIEVLGARTQDYIIVDEVDSMLVDKHNAKTILSSQIPNMAELNKIFMSIWGYVQQIGSTCTTNGQILCPTTNQLVNLDAVLLQIMRDLLLKQDYRELFSDFRLNYIEERLPIWIENAIAAEFRLQENVQYRVKQDEIEIIDFQNTGVTMKNQQWGQGLQQFVQLKHKVSLTPLSLATNFISTAGYFRRYKNRLYGLTGTLGQEATKSTLQKFYMVDFISMPPYIQRKLQPLQMLAEKNEEKWIEKIVFTTREEVNLGRAVLIINRSVSDARLVEQRLRASKLENIFLYEDDQQELIKELTPGLVIISTNLAGRGTDLRTSEAVEACGGLHVILTFLPANKRIEDQAFGRSARQGKKGTAQMIVLVSENIYTSSSPREDPAKLTQKFYERYPGAQFSQARTILFYRELKEEAQMKDMLEQMEQTLKEDGYFKQFCEYIDSDPSLRTQAGYTKFKQLEEHFGMQLELNIGNEEKMKQYFEGIAQHRINNPQYFIASALKEQDPKKVTSQLNLALQVQPKNFSALYYKSIFHIMAYENEQAEQVLKEAKEALEHQISRDSAINLSQSLNEMMVEANKAKMQETQINQQIQQLQKDEADEKVKKSMIIEERLAAQIESQHQIQQEMLTNIDGWLSTLKESKNKKIDIELKDLSIEQSPGQMDETMKKSVQTKSSIKSKYVKQFKNDQCITFIAVPKKPEEEPSKTRSLMYKVGLAIFGGIQCVLGAYCAAKGGSFFAIGLGLVKEGISDISLAVTSILSSEAISWGSWKKEKLFSFSMMIVSAGSQGLLKVLASQAPNIIKNLPIDELFGQIKKIAPISDEQMEQAKKWLGTQIEQKIKNLEAVFQDLAQASHKSLMEINEENKKKIERRLANRLINEEDAKLLRSMLSDLETEFQGKEFSIDRYTNSLNKNLKKLLKYYVERGAQNRPQEQQLQAIQQSCSMERMYLEENVAGRIREFEREIQEIDSQNELTQAYLFQLIIKDQELNDLLTIADIMALKQSEDEIRRMSTNNYYIKIFSDKVEQDFLKKWLEIGLDDEEQLQQEYEWSLRFTFVEAINSCNLIQQYEENVLMKAMLDCIKKETQFYIDQLRSKLKVVNSTQAEQAQKYQGKQTTQLTPQEREQIFEASSRYQKLIEEQKQMENFAKFGILQLAKSLKFDEKKPFINQELQKQLIQQVALFFEQNSLPSELQKYIHRSIERGTILINEQKGTKGKFFRRNFLNYIKEHIISPLVSCYFEQKANEKSILGRKHRY